ncbi:MlaD family protein [Streptomyces sp. LP05-1]|uniref:MlaD family protein n=1 Tax=Streptomyces pyxinae TaxID=2970734 RepID=A0ABT2CGA3_9ACTN|nr:MlaD family protein [Streptomyces sp. LP05-1]MCS0635731.1 MlaD family protein [Streptomyces sp. LP05-1]
MSPRAARIAFAVCGAAVATGLVFTARAGLPGLPGIGTVPLPGGADLGPHPYTVTAVFRDVTSLFPQSAVKVNDVPVGRVERITAGHDDWLARVTLRINGDVRLPRNAYATLEQSSLLGEKYVELSDPGSLATRPDLAVSGRDTPNADAPDPDAPGPAAPGPAPVTAPVTARERAVAGERAAGRLSDGDTIPVARTNRNAEVEEVFGALSMLLNGGGVGQLNTITRELGQALDGRQGTARSALRQISALARNLDAHKGDITEALDHLNTLSATLAARDQKVGAVLTRLSPGLKVLRDQRGGLVTMLRALDTLSSTAVTTIDRSKADTVAGLKALAPALKSLADAGQALPDALQVLVTYPFTDEVLSGVRGDYLNVYLKSTAAPGTTILPAHGAAAPGPAAGILPLPPVSASPEGDDTP